jgi:acyl-CoA synthetase (AMP-forming)/AMP-acid ligase II
MHLSYARGDTTPLIAETIGARLRATAHPAFLRDVARAGRALVALGVQPGDRVAVEAGDLVTAFGAVRAGAIVVLDSDPRRTGVTVEVAGGVAHTRGETVHDLLAAAARVSPVELLARELHFHPDDAVLIRGGATYSHRALVNRTAVLDVFADRGLAVFGHLPPNIEVKIVDPSTRATVPRGVAGEQWTRGFHVMLGYWNDPPATRAAIDADGWLHTGEVAVMEPDGSVRPAAMRRAAA